jgi:hypothetical protein
LGSSNRKRSKKFTLLISRIIQKALTHTHTKGFSFFAALFLSLEPAMRFCLIVENAYFMAGD